MATQNNNKIDDALKARWTRFGDYLRDARQRLLDTDPLWTQQYVADAAGIKRQTYSKLENGHPSKQKTILRVAAVLGLPQEEVLARAGNFYAPSPQEMRLDPLTLSVIAHFKSLPTDERKRLAAIVRTFAQSLDTRHTSNVSGTNPESSQQDAPLESAASHDQETRKHVGIGNSNKSHASAYP